MNRREVMKKSFVSLCLIFVTLVLFSSQAYPWGSLTHAYIADHIGKTWGLRNVNEIYGAMVPDVFNYVFGLAPTLDSYLRGYTHGIPAANGNPAVESFMDVWYSARWWWYEKALAYGFISHNDVWAADSTAHGSACLYPGEGYIISRAEILNEKLVVFLASKGIVIPDEIAMEISHNLVEGAGDVVIRRYDAELGLKVITSSLFRSPACPNLLIRAIGEYYRDMVTNAEREFRKTMILYGAAFLPQNEEEIVLALSQQMAELGKAYLASIPIELPLSDEELLDLIVYLMDKAIQLIEGDYMAEIEATVSKVKSQFWSRWIFYW
jgi:hypothetical protein